MTRFLVRTMALSIALAILVAVPAATQTIKKGVDYWRTPAGGTKFKFPDGDVEALCHKKPDPSWNHEVSLKGVPTQGSDWDSAVARLANAKFDKDGDAHTLVQFKALALTSEQASDTPCGKLTWTARLARGGQPITKMKISKKSDRGGFFFADLALKVELQAIAVTGASVGKLHYNVKLPDPKGGTPWSFGAGNLFRPGMTETDNCIKVLRDKLGTFPPGSQHIYFISNLIAQGKCREQG